MEAQPASSRKSVFEFKWDSRAGPVLLINFGNKKLGFALFCHRRPERSFSIFGHTSLLCSRCTGLAIGIFGFIGLIIFHIQMPLIASIVMIVPMLIDGISQLFGFRESNNILRLLTGFMFTLGLLSSLVK